MYDTQALTTLLDGFSLLGSSMFSQRRGHVVKEAQECGACCGAWAAFFLDVPKREEIIMDDDFYRLYKMRPPEDNKVSYWYYQDGADALAVLLRLEPYQLNDLLRKYGAPDSPFSSDRWLKSHYEVLKSVIEEVTGLDHEPPVHEFPEDELQVEEIQVEEILVEAGAPCHLEAQPGEFILDR